MSSFISFIAFLSVYGAGMFVTAIVLLLFYKDGDKLDSDDHFGIIMWWVVLPVIIGFSAMNAIFNAAQATVKLIPKRG